MSGKLSKADRDIIAQQKDNNLESDQSVASISGKTRPSNYKMDESRSNRKSNVRRKNVDNESSSSAKRSEQSDSDDDWWSPPQRTLQVTTAEINLRWDQLQWKPHKDHFLRGSQDWGVYKNDVMFALQSIGYVKGIKLTNLDKANFGSMIRRSVTDNPRRIIEDLSSGSDMMKLLNKTYRQSGTIQAENFFNDLIELAYDGGNAIDFVTKFRVCVRDFKSTGQELADNITILIFKRAVEKRAHRWHYEASHTSKTKQWSLEELINDFISNHSLKAFHNTNKYYPNRDFRVNYNFDNKRGDKANIRLGQIENRGKLAFKPKINQGDKNPESKNQVVCYICGKTGHYANNCHSKRGTTQGPHRCHICRGNHYARECPARKSDHDRPLNQISTKGKEKMIEYNVGDDWYDEWMEENGIVNNPEIEETPHSSNDDSSCYGVSLNFAHQLNNASINSLIRKRWLFDTGADINATNNLKNFVKESVRNLRPREVAIRTGSGVIYPEKIGEVCLKVRNSKNKARRLRLKNVFYVKNLPVNIISGELFYRSGCSLQGEKLVDSNGSIISLINVNKRGFFLWLSGEDEPMKHIKSGFPCQLDKEHNSKNSKIPSDETIRNLTLWHRRLCHPSADRLRWTIKNTTGINLTPSDVINIPCEACDLGKSVKYTTNERRRRAEYVGEGWHCDLGSSNPKTMDGNSYYCLTTDDLSRYRFLKPLKTKKDAAVELMNILRNINAELQLEGRRVRWITIDGGRDWGMSRFEEFAADQGIDIIVSAPDNQHQNGVSERGIRFIQDAARCCTIQTKIPSVFWDKIMETTCYTLNMTSQSPVDQHKTPYEVFWSAMKGRPIKPDVSHLLIPGSRCITHVEKSRRIAGEKLDPRGARSVFLGYKGRTNKLVWILGGGRFLVSPNVLAYENVGKNLGWPTEPQEVVRSLPTSVQRRLRARKTNYAREEDYNRTRSVSPPHEPKGPGRPKKTIRRPFDEAPLFESQTRNKNMSPSINNEDERPTEEDSDHEEEIGQSAHCLIEKSIKRQLHNLHGDGDDMFRLLANSSSVAKQIVSPDEPNLQEAMSSSEKNEWLKAIFTEIKGCVDRKTFQFVPKNSAKQNGQIISAKWVLKKKYKSNMELDKFKARVVARGFLQKKGIDFNETTASTARSASWRVLMALAAINEWHILQADFISAYLAGDLKEVIYMRQFPYLKEFFNSNPDLSKASGYTEESIIQLQRPLYGLKQSGACWQDKVKSLMHTRGFKALAADDAIYFNKDSGVIVASYVDDFLLIGPDKSKISALTKSLNKSVPLNDLGEASWFLGVRVQRSSPTGSVRLDQKQYIDRSMIELELQSQRPVPTPMSVASRLDMKKYNGKASSTELYNYQRLIGKYNFSACMTRCDTSQAMSQLARYMCNPSPHHHKHALRVAQYLSGSANKGLEYTKDHRHVNEFGKYGLHCAVDASFADDFESSKSTTGYVIFMGGSPVIWRSKLQTTVSTLTCEAEYAAIFEATKDCAWIRTFLEELGQMPSGPIPVLEDNNGAIKWANSTGISSGRRHVRVEYNYATQEVRDKNITIRKVESKLNPADGLTKPLNNAAFNEFVERLGMVD
ncbi:BgTH12-01134 [Blumeria graminis f. sp. triticale]|uniref:BgTH12-01842 n=1 Tax=Blumeria graminis f. sp. triticale TaxID=1689686 RepID=A0A9W4GEA9_BLUGR|nr:BgTH12-04378 [Blumeria graminis f. sp. triticale]CAD6498793.1 BgTH12-04453 [Blumeria graminis f. sp. triticale]CAD6498994.1 BgTH12-04648 [Blumeria graminis f. sp. triticale]CAD6501591.1 BgTH12-01842 [Blumeria graminis f. sp. triticale]CAD6502506.1 BgTH12-05098 [Blumeria graminis f. sp. triticale]